MDITFDRGNEDEPKGHAFVYFRSSSDPDEVWASYLLILPITVDVTKYAPPFLMSLIPEGAMDDMSSFAFPPAPEQMGSFEQIMQLAEMRDDDVLFAGAFNTSDLPAMMLASSDAADEYTEIYNEFAKRSGVVEAAADDDALDVGSIGINEVMYGLMSDSEKLSELTALVGKLSSAVDSNDAAQIGEAEADIAALSRQFDFDHKTERIVEGMKEGGEAARRLTELYVRRCYCIVQEDYLELGNVEEQIAAIEGGINIDG